MSNGLHTGADGKARCWWCGDDPLYVAYHDQEWGRAMRDDTRLFEKISLEGFQAGLSWLTILRKRENFRRAFDGFDIARVAAFTEQDVARLVRDAGIIRHEGKIRSVINNAQHIQPIIREYGSFLAFLEQFRPQPHTRPPVLDLATLKAMPQTPESLALSKTLKKRGFSFVGPTTMYAFMQSVGLVNDHVDGCMFK